MRRFIIVLCLVIMLLLSSCTAKTSKEVSVVLNFSATVDVTEGAEKYTCEIINTDKDISSILIKSPENLNGINYKWNGNSYAIEYKDLFCESTVEYLPKSAFASILIDILKYIKSPDNIKIVSTDDDITTFIGENKNGKFTIECNTVDGLISLIEIKDLALRYEFSNQIIS